MRPDLSNLLGWMRQERIQFGSELSEALCLLPNLVPGSPQDLSEPYGFGHDRLRVLDEGIVLDIHDDTYRSEFQS